MAPGRSLSRLLDVWGIDKLRERETHEYAWVMDRYVNVLLSPVQRVTVAEGIVGEGSHLPKFDWQYAVTLDININLVEQAKRLSCKYDGKATLACLETDSPGWVEVPSKTSLNKIAISSLAANVPVCTIDSQYVVESRHL
jgi:hypothetical protein